MNRSIPFLLLALLLAGGLAGCGSEDVDLASPAITLSLVEGVAATDAVQRTFNAAAGAITFSGTMEVGAQVTATVNGAALAVVYDAAAGTWSGELTSPVEGANVVTVTASDRRGNLSNLYFTVNYDSVAPTLSFDRYITPTPNSAQLLGGLVEAGATLVVTSSNSASSCTPVTINNGAWSCPLVGLTANNRITVTATDAAENPTVLTKDLTMVATAPQLTIDDPVPTATGSLVLRGIRAEGHSVQVTPPSGVVAAAVAYPSTTTWECGLSNLLLGNNLLGVALLDAGSVTHVNAGTVVQYDVVPPLVAAVTPAAGTTVSGPVTTVTATFSELLDPATASGGLTLTDGAGNSFAATAAYDATTRTITYTVAPALDAPQTYTATLPTTIEDLAGNALVGSSWSFTVSQPTP